MASSLSDNGVQFVDGNVINSSATIPTTGTFTAGQIVISSAVGANVRLIGWKRLTTGAGHVLNTNWAEITSGITLGTAVATTSGTAIDFTGIPSWAKRITVMLNGVSTNGVSPYQVQVGSGSITNNGYYSSAHQFSNLFANSTTGLVLMSAAAAATTYSGGLMLFHISSNTWIGLGTLAMTGSGTSNGGNTPNLLGALDRVRFNHRQRHRCI